MESVFGHAKTVNAVEFVGGDTFSHHVLPVVQIGKFAVPLKLQQVLPSAAGEDLDRAVIGFQSLAVDRLQVGGFRQWRRSRRRAR